MGKIKNNYVTQGFSGKFGEDIIFRQVDGKTFFVKRARKSSPPSERQLEMRNKFAEASMFATSALANPQASIDYKVMAQLQGLKSAYLAAVSDFLTQPEIAGIVTSAYRGKVGDIISITSKVPYKITEINIRILGADGLVLESGNAVAREPKWRYTISTANPQVKGSRIVLVARDRQDKESTIEWLL